MPTVIRTTRRRDWLAAAAVLALPGLVRAQHHGHHQGQFERLNQPGRVDLPEIHAQQAVTDSPAPRAAVQGRWQPRAPLPIPRTEMAWAVAYRTRVHLVGGYAEQRVDRPYHHAYDPATDQWQALAQLPRGANHVGVATLGERLYAFGGFVEQNRMPHDEAFAFDGEKWTRIRRARSLRRDGLHRIGPTHPPDRRGDRQRLAPLDRLAPRLRPRDRPLRAPPAACRWRVIISASLSSTA
jgi:hypothetical protein